MEVLLNSLYLSNEPNALLMGFSQLRHRLATASGQQSSRKCVPDLGCVWNTATLKFMISSSSMPSNLVPRYTVLFRLFRR